MTPVMKRNIIQIVLLVACLGIGYAVQGWAGAAIGFGVFLVGVIATTVRRFAKFRQDTAAEQEPEETVSAPQSQGDAEPAQVTVVKMPGSRPGRPQKPAPKPKDKRRAAARARKS